MAVENSNPGRFFAEPKPVRIYITRILIKMLVRVFPWEHGEVVIYKKKQMKLIFKCFFKDNINITVES